jgi:DNA adenine methylase
MADAVEGFLRYPGGKRKMLMFLKQHLPTAKQIEGRYFEPFLGGGAVFFHLQPEQAVLTDANPDLIYMYKGIRYAPRKVWELYSEFGHTKQDYQYVRDTLEATSLAQRAARMLYLNRTCFKGMWRHNRDGDFNVGYGGQGRRWVITQELLLAIHKLLKSKVIEQNDFEDIIDETAESDFLFLDPPYRPNEREYKNNHYVWQKFCFSDHERLALALNRAKARGVKWAMTTSSHPDIVGLFHDNYVLPIPKGTGRRPGIFEANAGEVLISTYKTKGSKKI